MISAVHVRESIMVAALLTGEEARSWTGVHFHLLPSLSPGCMLVSAGSYIVVSSRNSCFLRSVGSADDESGVSGPPGLKRSRINGIHE